MNTGKDIFQKKYSVTASTDNLKEVRELIEYVCEKYGVNKKLVYEIILAVDEACTNIIKHAYHNAPNKKIDIQLTVSEKQFKIILTDTGEHFDPNRVPEPDIRESQKLKKGGGLGIYLIKKIMDKVKYTAKSNGNELTLIKNFM